MGEIKRKEFQTDEQQQTKPRNYKNLSSTLGSANSKKMTLSWSGIANELFVKYLALVSRQ